MSSFLLLCSYSRVGSDDVKLNLEACNSGRFELRMNVKTMIASRKKLITDEHSGRILVDKDLAEEEEKKMESIFKSI